MSIIDRQHEAMRAIDAIVESDETFERIHAAVQNIRGHLEARAHQTAEPFIPANLDGTIPPQWPVIPPELAELFG